MAAVLGRLATCRNYRPLRLKGRHGQLQVSIHRRQMNHAMMDPKARLTKQGVRDLNGYGPRQAKPGLEGVREGDAAPATSQMPATSRDEPPSAPPVAS